MPFSVLLSWEELCVLRARLIVGDRKKYAPTVRRVILRTVVLPVAVARANYSNGCFENASGGEEGIQFLLQPSCVSRAAKLRVPKKYAPTVRYKEFQMMPLPVAFDRVNCANGCFKNRASQRSFASSSIMLRRQAHKLLQHCICCVMAF